MSQPKQKSYTVGFEEKATPVMIYTASGQAWGDLVTKELVRVSIWLRSPTAPRYLRLYDCCLLPAGASTTPGNYRELFIPVSEITALHMLPPHQDPPDYDPNEPNRVLHPVTALIGPYRLDGSLRMSSHSNLEKFLELMTEKYTSMYEVKVSQPLRPDMKPLKVPFVLIRRENALVSE
jgi:hypothetical protein